MHRNADEGAARVTGWHVECCETLDDCARHLPAWAALSDCATYGEWFAGPDWLLPFLSTYFADRRLAVYFMYQDGALVGVVPLVQGQHREGFCRPDWELPVNPHVRRIGILANVSPQRVLSEVLERTNKASGVTRSSCIGLLQVPEGEWLDLAVRSTARAVGLVRNTVRERRSALVDVKDGWDAYVATRSRDQLHPLRKERKLRARGAGTWAFVATPNGDGFEDRWERVLHVEARSWKQANGTSLLNDPGADLFYRSVALSQSRRGSLRIDLLEHDGEPVAHTLGVVYGTTYYLLKHSYDETFRALSPGFQLLWYTMQQRVTEGCTRLDLLGDEMPWKRAVATSLPRYVSHQLFAPSDLRCQLCRLTEQVVKPAARALGMQRLAEWYRHAW